MNKKYLKLKTWANFISYTFSRKYKGSYSQNAEDLLISAAAKRMKIETVLPRYRSEPSNLWQ